MTQMHELCLMNYDLAILDTAFLIHKPGIKEPPKAGQKNPEIWRKPYVTKNSEIYDEIMSDMRATYGVKEKCKEHN
jgi:beta-1,4-glucuronyltransferase 1